MIKELIFNKLKWKSYQDNEQAIILPKMVKVPNWTRIGDYEEGTINGYNASIACFKSDTYVPVYGMKNGRYVVYASDGHIGSTDGPQKDWGKGDQVLVTIDPRACQIQNGESNNLLSHLYQRFSYALSTFREAVRVW